MFQKNQVRKKIELFQNDYTFTKISELYREAKCSDILKLYTLKTLLSKNLSHLFFLIS